MLETTHQNTQLWQYTHTYTHLTDKHVCSHTQTPSLLLFEQRPTAACCWQEDYHVNKKQQQQKGGAGGRRGGGRWRWQTGGQREWVRESRLITKAGWWLYQLAASTGRLRSAEETNNLQKCVRSYMREDVHDRQTDRPRWQTRTSGFCKQTDYI